MILATILLAISGLYALTLVGAVLGGRKIAEQLVAAYAGPHEYREVQPHQIPGVPAGEYRSVRAELESLGFRYCGAVENETISGVYPELRTYIEAFAHETQTVYAASYHARDPRAPQQVVDLESWFEDGSFLVTTNGRQVGKLTSPASIARNKVDAEAPLRHLWDTHRAALAERGERTGPKPRDISSLSAIMTGQRAFSAEEARHRQGLGYLTPSELETIAAGIALWPGALRALRWAMERRVAALTRQAPAG